MRSLILLVALGAVALAASPDPNRGLYAIWTGQDPKLIELPFIKGEVISEWKDVEPAEGRYAPGWACPITCYSAATRICGRSNNRPEFMEFVARLRHEHEQYAEEFGSSNKRRE